MTWVSNKATLVAGMPTGYREIQNALEVDEQSKNYNHKAYTVRVGDPSTKFFTNSELLSSDLVILDVVYRIGDSDTYDTNKDLFTTLHDTIKGLSLFMSMKRYNFRRHPETNKLCLGTLEFYWGYRSC